jgi:hypothetical protein
MLLLAIYTEGLCTKAFITTMKYSDKWWVSRVSAKQVNPGVFEEMQGIFQCCKHNICGKSNHVSIPVLDYLVLQYRLTHYARVEYARFEQIRVLPAREVTVLLAIASHYHIPSIIGQQFHYHDHPGV